jgi:peptidoglycan/LPS O-acetylase OafA/YrhL
VVLTRRWSSAVALAVVLVAGLGFFAVATVLTQAGEARVLWQHAAPALFWKWALGAVLAEMLLNAKLRMVRQALAQWWLVFPVAAALYAGSFIHGGAYELTHQRFVLPVVCAALVGLFVFSPLSQLRSAVGEWLGDISYSVYLWHPLAIALVLAYKPQGGGEVALGALALTLLFAVPSYRWLEQPFMRMAQKRKVLRVV